MTIVIKTKTEYDELVDRAKSGDAAAFDELVKPIKSRVRNVIRKMIGHPEDSEDILQNALLKVWQGVGDFQNRANFSTWLTSIATRAAIDFLRSQKRWRPEAQVAYANLCAQSEELNSEVIAQYGGPDFAYEVREHISYCFTCVGRSLPRMNWRHWYCATWWTCRRAKPQPRWAYPIPFCGTA